MPLLDQVKQSILTTHGLQNQDVDKIMLQIFIFNLATSNLGRLKAVLSKKAIIPSNAVQVFAWSAAIKQVLPTVID